MAKLHALDALSSRMFSPDAALVITLMRQVADRYVSASIYRPLMRLSALRPDRAGRLVRYGRDQFGRRGLAGP